MKNIRGQRRGRERRKMEREGKGQEERVKKRKRGGGGEGDREKKRPAKDASREERWLSPLRKARFLSSHLAPAALKRCFLSPLLFIHLPLSLSLSLLLSLRSLVLRWLRSLARLLCLARLTSHLKPTNTSAFVYAYRVNAATARAIIALYTFVRFSFLGKYRSYRSIFIVLAVDHAVS